MQWAWISARLAIAVTGIPITANSIAPKPMYDPFPVPAGIIAYEKAA